MDSFSEVDTKDSPTEVGHLTSHPERLEVVWLLLLYVPPPTPQTPLSLPRRRQKTILTLYLKQTIPETEG